MCCDTTTSFATLLLSTMGVATGVASRAFGTWTALSSAIRLLFVLKPRNKEYVNSNLIHC